MFKSKWVLAVSFPLVMLAFGGEWSFADDSPVPVKGFSCEAKGSANQTIKGNVTLSSDGSAVVELEDNSAVFKADASSSITAEPANTRLAGCFTYNFQLPNNQGWFRVTLDHRFPQTGWGWMDLNMEGLRVNSELDCKTIQ